MIGNHIFPVLIYHEGYNSYGDVKGNKKVTCLPTFSQRLLLYARHRSGCKMNDVALSHHYI